jgi:hypothetical protein
MRGIKKLGYADHTRGYLVERKLELSRGSLWLEVEGAGRNFTQ